VSTGALQFDHMRGFWSPQTVAFSPDGTSAYIGLQQESGRSSTAGLVKVSVRTGKIESGIALGQGGVGNVVVAPDGTKAFVSVQVDVKGVYSGVFAIVPVETETLQPHRSIVVGDVQGLGVLQFGSDRTLLAVDTQWRIATVAEQTDRIVAASKVPVPSLLAATLKPISFRG
jgi:DNA-binding beta-propeller fold protein YncE